MRVAGVLLAAGAGRRLGKPKALVELAGQTLVERGAGMLAAAGCKPVVVVGGAWVDGAPALDLHGADLIVNPQWMTGQASSLAAGLAALDDRVAAAVISLVDQPFVAAAAVQRLVEAHERAAVAATAATYGGAARNPVVLGRSVWQEVLAAAAPDEGARAWLQAHPERVLEVPCDDLGSPRDLDTPDDLVALRQEAAAWS